MIEMMNQDKIEFTATYDNKGYLTIFDIDKDKYEKTKKDLIAKYKKQKMTDEEIDYNVQKELDKLQKNLGGIKEMKRIPDAIFIVDPKKERICVQEAHTLGIPLIGICDTNCDPEELDYVIPGNDDAIRAVNLIVSKMADAVIEAKQGTAEADGEIEAESEEFAATEE